jgi:hypothetical protein
MTDFRALCARMADELDHYRQLLMDDRRATHALATEARTTLAQPEPQGPPKNCWLDDEPHLCPSPCVFDDPSEVIDDCVKARYLSEKNKPKEACKYYRTTAQPEPQGPTLNCDEIDVPWSHLGDDFHVYKEGYTAGWAEGVSAALARWGRPAIEPVPVSERLPGPEDCDAEGRCWVGINLGSCGHRSWILDLIADNDSGCWLPHHALPVPKREAEQ